ncbi:PEP-CTERM sorting domain-containing protein [Okeania sp. KiyG1]|uniref:PEP-CTERM sorting domain-containing protein n=1 Tax=Okeania sp. KiyG1 TaxID=2720165 RepID=UPI0019245D24|nr:PEP-CTERM sorting domain-containing protein [Okeania sp. KiyG1]GGA34395.1 hypothetical protein CYANOKiyG1_51650 [Okeania sp. KiyG1]
MSNHTNHQRHRLTSLSQAVLVAIASTFGVGVKVALADPAVNPPTTLPQVFCFRFTDIKAVEDDPEGDKFQIAFEVLNWSNQPAAGVRIALNQGTRGFEGAAPTLAGAGIDANGRPLGPDADPLTGNQLFTNTGSVVQSTDTAIQWDASQFNFNTFIDGPIPNRDLLAPGPRNTPGACALVPGCQVVGHPNPFFGRPNIADPETIDDGNNVLDGFVITVDDFDETEVLSFNWDLLNVAGNRIGDTNDFGFGTVNIARLPINETGDPDADFRIFEQNTGVGRSNRLFAENSHTVTEYSPVDYDTTIAGGLSASNAEATQAVNSTGGDEPIALFAAEFSPGLTGAFLNSADNIFGAPVNATLIASNPGDGGSGDVGSGDGGSGDVGSGDGGSGDVGSGDGGSGDVGSGDGGSGDVGSGDGGSGDVGSGDGGSGDVGSGDGGSGDIGSGDIGSGDVGSGDIGSGDIGSGDIQPESVPEPSTLAMLGMTTLALLGYKRRRS